MRWRYTDELPDGAPAMIMKGDLEKLPSFWREEPTPASAMCDAAAEFSPLVSTVAESWSLLLSLIAESIIQYETVDLDAVAETTAVLELLPLTKKTRDERRDADGSGSHGSAETTTPTVGPCPCWTPPLENETADPA